MVFFFAEGCGGLESGGNLREKEIPPSWNYATTRGFNYNSPQLWRKRNASRVRPPAPPRPDPTPSGRKRPQRAEWAHGAAGRWWDWAPWR